MKPKPTPEVELCRVREGQFKSDESYGNNGMFQIERLDPLTSVTNPLERKFLTIIASDQGGWDHVSVSLPNRCPTWDEMCYVKDLFWNDEETVVQYHPPKSKYINNYPYCLHLWKPKSKLKKLPLPPKWMVGI